MKKYILIFTLLLPPLSCEAIDNPFKSDHRPDGIIVLSVSLFVAGVYLIAKKSSPKRGDAYIEALVAPLFLALGIGGVFCSRDIVKLFDDLKKK